MSNLDQAIIDLREELDKDPSPSPTEQKFDFEVPGVGVAGGFTEWHHTPAAIARRLIPNKETNKNDQKTSFDRRTEEESDDEQGLDNEDDDEDEPLDPNRKKAPPGWDGNSL